LFVANSRHLVSENKNTKKLMQNTRKGSGTLLMTGFQIFAADAAFQNHAQRDFLTHPTKKNALSSPDFCQKAWHDPNISDM